MTQPPPQSWRDWTEEGRVVFGWRAWRLIDDALYPISHVPHVWRPQGNVARCHAYARQCRPEDVPRMRCMCGFWAMRRWEHFQHFVTKGIGTVPVGDGVFLGDRWSPTPTVYVVGQVALWGNVVVCEHGWRASRANVLCIARSDHTAHLETRGFVLAPFSEMCDYDLS